MTTTGWIILLGYSALVVVGVSIALIVFRSTRVGFRAEPAEREQLENRESMWGIAVAVFLVSLLLMTIFEIPYSRDKHESAAQKMEIVGQQFAWSVDPPHVRAGIRTAVDAHSRDVSHAVGIYNPNGTLIKQINVVPGVTVRFVITFSKPGTYKLRCLEFCGIDHHKMENDLKVTR